MDPQDIQSPDDDAKKLMAQVTNAFSLPMPRKPPSPVKASGASVGKGQPKASRGPRTGRAPRSRRQPKVRRVGPDYNSEIGMVL